MKITNEAELRAANRALAEARHDAQTLGDEYQDALGRWLAAHADEAATVAQAEARAKLLESEVRAALLDYHQATGERTPGYGFSITRRRLHPYEPADALAWALTEGRYDLLTLDRRAFEAELAERSEETAPPFVTHTWVFGTAIAGDLGKALVTEEIKAELAADAAMAALAPGEAA